MFDHNLPLVTKFSQHAKQQAILHKLCNSKQILQSREKKYVHPYINIPHHTLQIRECNPYEKYPLNYIHNSNPPLPLFAQENNKDENYQATLSLKRVTWLWERYWTFISIATSLLSPFHKTLPPKYFYQSTDTSHHYKHLQTSLSFITTALSHPQCFIT